MSSRDEILGRVRAGLQRNAANAAAGREVMAAALSSNSHGPKPVFDATPQALLERVAARHTVAAGEKGIALKVEPGQDLPAVMVDPERMAQVLDISRTTLWRKLKNYGFDPDEYR